MVRKWRRISCVGRRVWVFEKRSRRTTRSKDVSVSELLMLKRKSRGQCGLMRRAAASTSISRELVAAVRDVHSLLISERIDRSQCSSRFLSRVRTFRVMETCEDNQDFVLMFRQRCFNARERRDNRNQRKKNVPDILCTDKKSMKLDSLRQDRKVSDVSRSFMLVQIP